MYLFQCSFVLYVFDLYFFFLFFFFFFQAEDGIRDTSVTGVQTCALPICHSFASTAFVSGSKRLSCAELPRAIASISIVKRMAEAAKPRIKRFIERRSEERRVGKECRSRRLTYY